MCCANSFTSMNGIALWLTCMHALSCVGHEVLSFLMIAGTIVTITLVIGCSILLGFVANSTIQSAGK